MGEDTPPTKELSKLKRAGLVNFTESAIEVSPTHQFEPEFLSLLGGRGGNRLVPVPRQVLKFLASCTKPALAKTVIAYLLRGLSLAKDGEIRGAGTIKISWICKLCKISERAARAARAKLISLGWITKDIGSFQRKLNRDGAYFVINAAWNRTIKFCNRTSPSMGSSVTAEDLTEESLSDPQKQFAPLGVEKCTDFAPPSERIETPKGSKNQKPLAGGLELRTGASVDQDRSGVCVANNFKNSEKPTLKDIQIDDLRRLSRLKDLYNQALKANWLAHSEANLRNFVAAAARATRVQGDPIRVFVGIVKKGLWHHLTNDDERRATTAFKRARQRTVLSDRTTEKNSKPILRMQEILASVVEKVKFTVDSGEHGKSGLN